MVWNYKVLWQTTIILKSLSIVFDKNEPGIMSMDGLIIIY